MTTAAERLTRVWETPRNLTSALATIDHKIIGVRYIVTGFIFFLLAGIAAIMMRTQLAQPELKLASPATYNQLFTLHGTTMIFLFATPIQFGIATYIVPLMIGTRDMAFPRLNAFAYWVFLFAGAFMWASVLAGAAPTGGWFSYVPLTGPTYTVHWNQDFWLLGLIFLAVSTTAGALNFIVTIFKLRAPGMSINRIPLFLWSVLATSFAVIFALPALTAANIMLEFDRRIHTHFFDPAGGGQPLLWQHLSWFFGHPDVYIIVLPALGMVSMILPVFARRRILGYTLIALATVTTGLISFGVWVHHMFATGLPSMSMSFFGAASMMITIPSGIQIFAWLATLITGRPVLKTPFLWVLGFLVLFVMGGVTGVMFAALPFDWQATDSYFVVAHFHYVLIGGAVFPIFGGLYYWIPKMTGKMMSEWLGQTSFWLTFIGFNLTFLPMHIVGLLGMPRRVYTYQPGLGWGTYNLVETIGAYIIGLGVLVFIMDFLLSLRFGRPAGDNPWNADTLEWATSSPPPPYNFRYIPRVRSREPLWDEENPAEANARLAGARQPLTEPRGGRRELLDTSLLDAEPEAILEIPEETLWPLGAAFGLLIMAVGFLPYLPVIQASVAITGGVLTLVSVIAWTWPKTKEEVPA